MDAGRLIYEPLSGAIQMSAAPLKESEPFMKSFLKSLLPEGDQDTIDGSLKKTYSLVGMKGTQKKRPQKRAKGSLSLRERRHLGLYQLRRHGSNYIDAVPVHELWREYMMTVLSLHELNKTGFTAKPEDKMWEQVSMALYRADYHGAEIEVIKSKCSSLFGIKGIVLMETKNTFKIIGKDNVIRTIPKPPCAFSFSLLGYRFKLFGKYLCTVPANRCSKKPKVQVLADL